MVAKNWKSPRKPKTPRKPTKELAGTVERMRWDDDDTDLLMDWILRNQCAFLNTKTPETDNFRANAKDTKFLQAFTWEQCCACWKTLYAKYKELNQRRKETSGGGVTDVERAKYSTVVSILFCAGG